MSFSKDSVSDGVRRVMLGEVTTFRFCERVEAAASGFAESLFDITITGSQFRQGFGRQAQGSTVEFTRQRERSHYSAPILLDVRGESGQGATLRQGVVDQEIRLAGLHFAIEFRLLEDPAQAIQRRALGLDGLKDAAIDR
ncbi:hypothetical protein D3C71_1208320 [compost metagenome]